MNNYHSNKHLHNIPVYVKCESNVLCYLLHSMMVTFVIVNPVMKECSVNVRKTNVNHNPVQVTVHA